ncbi:hypothetical protein WJX82_006816 [Trebouxia sp. C0006]
MASFDLQQSYQAPTLPPISSNHQSPVPAISSLSPDQTYAKSVAAEIVSLTSTTVLRSRYSLSKAAVPFGALVTPLPNLHSPSLPPLLQRSPTVCDACGAYLNAYCKVQANNITWQCCFCHTRNNPVRITDLRSCAELRSEAVDYFQQDLTGQAVSQAAETLVLVVDTTAGAQDLQAAKSILIEVLRQLPRSWRLMLLTFSSAVSVYQLANRGLVTADVVSGEWQNSSSRQKPSQFQFGGPEPLHVAALQSCQEAAEQAISSWRATSTTGPSREQPRCLGAALAVALHLLAAPGQHASAPKTFGSDALPVPQACRPSRVLLVTTGPATKGPGWVPLSNLDSRQGPEDPQASKGAAQFFQGLAQQAAQAGVAVDVVAVGQAAVNVPLLGALTQQTGGAIFSHQRFEEVSGAGLASALQRRQGVEGFMDVHTSTGLGVTHVTGPTTPLNRANLGSNSMQRHFKPTMNACELVSVETGQGIAVGLDITRDLQVEYVYMQVILGWRALEGGWLQRVVTHRLSTTGSLQTVLSGTDWGLAAVVAGKRWVKQAQAKGAAQDCRAAQVLRKQIGQHVRCQVVSQAAGGPSAWGALTWLAPPPPAILPPFLQKFAQVMYQLQRGPMLGEVAGHADERAILHTTFLAASTPVALLMMAPALYVYSTPSAAFQQVPALDLAIQTDEAIVLDCGSQIFMRLGLQTGDDPAHSAQPDMQALVQQMVLNRIPAPGLLRIDQESPDMRYMAARLMPTWGDSLEEQQQQYPALLSLTADQVATVQQQRMPTDEPSFNQEAVSQYVRCSQTAAQAA